MSVAADDPAFLGEREVDRITRGAETLDLSSRTRLLRPEIIRRHAEHDETAAAVALPQRLKVAVLRCVSAVGGGVDDKHRSAAPGVERQPVTIDRCEFEPIGILGGAHRQPLCSLSINIVRRTGPCSGCISGCPRAPLLGHWVRAAVCDPDPMLLAFFLTGIVVGIIIAVPVGPVGVMCVRRTIFEGKIAGFVSGLGAATADAVFGIIAAFGLTVVSDWLIDYQQWLRAAGGCYLLYIGGRAFAAKPPAELEAESDPESLLGDFASTFVLAITNPITILAFLGIFTAIGFSGTQATFGR